MGLRLGNGISSCTFAFLRDRPSLNPDHYSEKRFYFLANRGVLTTMKYISLFLNKFLFVQTQTYHGYERMNILSIELVKFRHGRDMTHPCTSFHHSTKLYSWMFFHHTLDNGNQLHWRKEGESAWSQPFLSGRSKLGSALWCHATGTLC